MFKFSRTKKEESYEHPIQILNEVKGVSLSLEERIKLTTSCMDCSHIKKAKGAGSLVKYKDDSCQVMFNGLKVKEGCYYGDWMTEIIRTLKGHHEPQEEKVFSEVLKKIDNLNPIMIELGSFWAFYSMWFLKEFEGSRAYCLEPDPTHLDIGKYNMAINGFEDRHISTLGAAGAREEEIDIRLETSRDKISRVIVKPVDSIVRDNQIDKIDILHLDVQGAELSALNGALSTIRSGKVRFLFVSTHHHSISSDPLMHEKCKDFIYNTGGSIIAEHTIQESYSGDGLLVASYDDRDNDFVVPVSRNRESKSLFRPYEQDVNILLEYIKGKKP